MSARIGEALRELEQDMAGLRLRPAAEVRARGRARSRRRAAVLAGVVAVTVTGGAATMAALSGPAAPMPAAGGAATPSATASAACQADPPVRLDVVFRPGTGSPQIGEVDYRIGQARGDTGLRCGGRTVAARPDGDGRVVLSVLLAQGEDPAPIRAAVEKLPGVERVVTAGG
ncbi:hypothetical protein [Micromonospora aurantiaca (nom. illeg.)]|uniref:hypothetical protein n=1 Tax=Micromonospora aurantiaca (nom. illeg.) TaxID=47850 RepID=UPI003EBCBA5A